MERLQRRKARLSIEQRLFEMSRRISFVVPLSDEATPERATAAPLLFVFVL